MMLHEEWMLKAVERLAEVAEAIREGKPDATIHDKLIGFVEYVSWWEDWADPAQAQFRERIALNAGW